MQRIVVPVDGSEGANAAAALAAEMAEGLGAEVVLLHVYDAPTAAALGLAHLSHQEVEETKERVAAGAFEAARAAIGDGVEVSTHVSIGNPGHEIVTHAKQTGATLIVMGSRGLNVVQSWLIGSVSQWVLHHATCPVAIVPLTDEVDE